jgi:hypothetical protein
MSEEIVVKFRLLPWQVRAREMRKVRELVVVNTGIHTGKTVWGATELLDDMLQHPGETYWWGRVGLATDASGETSHVLVRAYPGDKR